MPILYPHPLGGREQPTLQPPAVPNLSDSQLPTLTKTPTRVWVMQGQERRPRSIPPRKITAMAFRGHQVCWVLHNEHAACHRLQCIKPGTFWLGKAQWCQAQAQKAVLKEEFPKSSVLDVGNEMPLDFSRDRVKARAASSLSSCFSRHRKAATCNCRPSHLCANNHVCPASLVRGGSGEGSETLHPFPHSWSVRLLPFPTPEAGLF